MPPDVRPEMSTTPPLLVTSRAKPPVLLSWKKVASPLFVMMVALPAVLVSVNLRRKLLVMVALPAVLVAVNLRRQLLVMVELPAVLVSVNLRRELLVMAALPAVLVLAN